MLGESVIKILTTQKFTRLLHSPSNDKIKGNMNTLHYIPYSLYLIPYTLFLIPYSLYLIPYSLCQIIVPNIHISEMNFLIKEQTCTLCK